MRISDWSSDVCSSDLVPTPFPAQELQAGHSQDSGILKAGQEHTDKTNGFEIFQSAYHRCILPQGNAELVPGHFFGTAVDQLHLGGYLIGNVVPSYLHVFGPDGYLVLIIGFYLAGIIIPVNIFSIGKRSGGTDRKS